MEQDFEKISIGMPVYNDRSFLPAALESLLNQSYRNFELIISDDCSTDGSREICLKAAQLDKRIKYIRQSTNIGISRNMEFLLQEAKGEYFMWAANDDLWHPDFIKNLSDRLRKNPDAIVSFCSVIEIDEEGNTSKTWDADKISYAGKTPYQRLTKLINVFYDGFGYGLFKRQSIKEVTFPVWWWINKNCAYNNVYPTLCFYLTKGDYVHWNGIPLWYNRIKHERNIHHKTPYSNSFARGYLAFVLRKFNLIICSLRAIKRAQGSNALIMRVLWPMFIKWFVKPVYYEFKHSLKRLFRRDISFW